MLLNKNILIAITGSIAIYKSCELIRLFIKAGANVRVVMSNGAKKFITTLTFEALTSQKVLDETSENWANDYNHIAIGKWADLFVIAPATANTINKLSNGIADNLITQIAIAYPRLKIIAPAANTNMIENPLSVASLKMLSLCNYEIIKSTTKELACKDIGNGAMAEPEEIFYASVRALNKTTFWENRNVVVSAGGTIEKIDDVRYISNFSSGIMGASLAKALYFMGANVCLVTTKEHKLPAEIHIINVQNSIEMENYLNSSIEVAKKGIITKNTLMDKNMPSHIVKKPFVFMAAAISDFVPKYPQNGKLKKDTLGDEWSLTLIKNKDILSSLNKNNIFCVGFKAEMDKNSAKFNAEQMLISKNLDAVCLNTIDENNPFGGQSNTMEILFRDEVLNFTLSGDKLDISIQILKNIEDRFNDK